MWLLNRAGGEAEKLTDIEGGVDDYEWSPDSKRLVLVVSDPIRATIPRRWKGGRRRPSRRSSSTAMVQARSVAGYLQHLRTHLYLFDIATKKAEQITSGDFDDGKPAWSPDGTRIAFVSERDNDPDRSNNPDIFVIDARAGATPRQLTTYPGRTAAAGVEPRRQDDRVPSERRTAVVRLRPSPSWPSSRRPAARRACSPSRSIARSARPLWTGDGK